LVWFVNERAQRLRERVKRFAIAVMKFVGRLPTDTATAVLAKQLARSGAGVSSNYHAACRARSRAEFVAKLGVVVEETDETEHWLDILLGTGMVSGRELDELRAEIRELGAIFRASLATARANLERSRGARR
jgi:four helix bundle protein